MFVMSGESYYQIGSLLPLPGTTTKFAKLYIYDNENEVNNIVFFVGWNLIVYLKFIFYIISSYILSISY